MHFSKTYEQLLLSLPADLRDNAIQYRELKRVIHRIVDELSSLGLDPQVLHTLIEASETEVVQGKDGWIVKHLEHAGALSSPSMTTLSTDEGEVPKPGEASGEAETETEIETESVINFTTFPKVVYEVNASGEGDERKIEPRLRIWIAEGVGFPGGVGRVLSTEGINESNESLDEVDKEVQSEAPQTSLLWALQRRGASPLDNLKTLGDALPAAPTEQVIIPLVHDTEFYSLLSMTLESVSDHLSTIHKEFVHTLENLSTTIGNSSHPASGSAGFHPYSAVTTHAGSISVQAKPLQSDLYFWREIFQLYLDAEVFESVGEINRGERSVEESEKRLQLFAERVTQRGLGDSRKFKLRQSVDALETFLSLNLFILNIKKLSYANSEATRKILKKHAKRTALTLFPGSAHSSDPSTSLLALVSHPGTSSLPRTLVQAIGETLLPVIPSVDDYACLICTSIAFKPIRLHCGHLFCVRCLVKMQKRGKANCPMCRAPSVLVANRSNVDWALLNFMQDWFPVEAKEKLEESEREAAVEQAKELGFDPDSKCVIM